MGEPHGSRADFSDPGRIKALIEIINYVLVELQPISPMTAYLLALARRNLMEEFAMEPAGDGSESQHDAGDGGHLG